VKGGPIAGDRDRDVLGGQQAIGLAAGLREHVNLLPKHERPHFPAQVQIANDVRPRSG